METAIETHVDCEGVGDISLSLHASHHEYQRVLYIHTLSAMVPIMAVFVSQRKLFTRRKRNIASSVKLLFSLWNLLLHLFLFHFLLFIIFTNNILSISEFYLTLIVLPSITVNAPWDPFSIHGVRCGFIITIWEKGGGGLLFYDDFVVYIGHRTIHIFLKLHR